MDENAFVQMDIISMEQFAYFVSMVRNGISQQEAASVQKIIHGMEIYVKDIKYVQEVEFSSDNMSNAYVQMEHIGMELNV